MVPLTSLLLPIVLSAVIVFLASSVIHMLTRWHDADYAAVPNEAGFRAALGPMRIPPGDYIVPRPASRGEVRTPEFTARVNEGPNVILTVLPNGPWTMGRNLGLWFLYLAIVALFAGYIGSRALGPGAEYLEVFRFVGTTAFLGLTGALWQMSIWWRRSWGTTVRATIDGLLYALLMAGTFGWLWPR